MADDAELLEHHACANLLAHLVFGLVEPVFFTFALRIALARVGVGVDVGGVIGFLVVGGAERGGEFPFDQVLALLAASRYDVLQGNQLLVDFFSSASLDDRVVRLASQDARLATSAILVEDLFISFHSR